MTKDGADAKFWLVPEVVVAYNQGFTAKALRELLELVITSFWRLEMSSSPAPTRVRFDEDHMWVDLTDGRVLGVPLAWFPRLLKARPDQREGVTVSSNGLHWEDLDEDVSVSGLLAGRGDQTGSSRVEQAA